MTVQEIFALRKQGKVEEAYEAIRPIYREHKGKFTTLCMFWVASDVFKLRLEQKRVEEAVKIYEALRRLLPRIEEIEESDVVPTVHPVIPSEECHPEQRRGISPQGRDDKRDVRDDSALSKSQQAVLDCIKIHPGLKVPEIETDTGIPAKSIERHIKVLIERNLIEHRGSKKTGGYHAL